MQVQHEDKEPTANTTKGGEKDLLHGCLTPNLFLLDVLLIRLNLEEQFCKWKEISNIYLSKRQAYSHLEELKANSGDGNC